MIPLIRPTFPNMERVCELFEIAQRDHIFTNFGKLHHKLHRELYKVTNKYCLPVTSGTTAIEVALRLLNAERVIIPDYTHSGTYLAAVRANCKPLLMSCDPNTWTLDLELLEKHKDTYDTFILVCPFGYAVNVQDYEEFAKLNNKQIVYDFAGAWPYPVGTEFPVCYSFHSTKNSGAGEGGVVCFGTEDEYKQARTLVNFGTLPDRTIAGDQGFNGKIDELRCAVILAMLEETDRLESRQASIRALIKHFSEEFDVRTPVPLFPSLCVLPGFKAKELEINPDELGMVFKQYYPLLSEMPRLRSEGFIRPEVSEYFNSCVAIPCDVSIEEMVFVQKTLAGFKL